MRILKFKTFGGMSKDEKLAEFVNTKSIQQEDIVQIVVKTGNGDFTLYYYSQD